MSGKSKQMICLGDSYTIGESVAMVDRFPEKTVELLNKEAIHFGNTEIVARTGWTTSNLINAIKDRDLKKDYDYVTLLIGVNDQFQGIDTTEYKQNFEHLLQTAILFANKKPEHVFVLSIPDYGVTPFAKYGRQSPAQISAEIDIFNTINLSISLKYNVNFIDVTPISRMAKDDSSLLADDGLHPSGLMYKQWAILLSRKIMEMF